MRRKDREITDEAQLRAILRRCDVCRVALFDEPYPYIVPLNFGMSGEGEPLMLYFHCAPEGHKLDLLRKNRHVGFEMDCAHRLVAGSRACDSTMEYESVCGNGLLELCEDWEKAGALARIMAHCFGEQPYAFDESVLRQTAALRLTVNTITAKALKKHG